MEEFSTYDQMRKEGVSSLDAYLHAKKNGFDAFKRIRMLRSIYNLSLEDAQKTSFKGDTGRNIVDSAEGNREEYKNILDDELGLRGK
jgi:flagellar motor component MotA